MLLKIRHALLEISNHPTKKQSAIIINGEVVITTGSILLPYVRPMLPFESNSNETNVCASTKIIRALQQCRLVDAGNQTATDEAEHLNALSYQVIFDRHKLPPNEHRQAQILIRQRANLLYLFNSAEVSRYLHKFLQNPEAQADNALNEVLISSFLVLSINHGHTEQHQIVQRFLQLISHYIRYLQPLQALDDVLTMATPFGMEHLFKSISIGKVSNVLGRESALFLISNALPLGCEGSAVFNNKLRLIGIIICTSFQRQQENVNLTLVASFAHILSDFMRQLGVEVTSITLRREPSSNFTWERAMVVIKAGGKQGTGTFVKIQQRKFILTCAHVLYDADNKVSCRNIDGIFESEVLWRNRQYNRPYDVALIAAPALLPDRYCARLSTAKPCPGQMVYNAGFPCALNFNLKYDFSPSIFQGRVIKYGPGAIVSDGCVQTGQSGGPMFDQQGNVLGICVTNIRLEQIVYPNVNTAVPVCEIRETLQSFAKSNDITVLDNLVANNSHVWAPQDHKSVPILCKL